MTNPPARPTAELPDLRVVPVDSLVPHETHDMQRSVPLIERLRVEGVLRNPPIVAPFDDGRRFVILDGTNRVMAFSALAYPHIVVQVVDYESPELILETWFHLVTGMTCDELLDAIDAIDGLRREPSELLHARAELARRQAIAAVTVPETCEPPPGGPPTAGEPVTARGYVVYAEGDTQRRAEVLRALVGAYEARGRLNRVSTDHLEHLLPHYADVAGLIVFPRYEPSEVIELAQQGIHLPPGITRHIIHGRALRLNFPLDVLARHQPLDEKNAWLQAWLHDRLAGRAIRYYQEATYVFDE